MGKDWKSCESGEIGCSESFTFISILGGGGTSEVALTYFNFLNPGGSTSEVTLTCFNFPILGRGVHWKLL